MPSDASCRRGGLRTAGEHDPGAERGGEENDPRLPRGVQQLLGRVAEARRRWRGGEGAASDL